MPGQVGDLLFQPHQPVDEELVIVVVAQHEMEPALGSGRGQFRSHWTARPPTARWACRPSGNQGFAAKDEDLGVGGRAGELLQVAVGRGAVGQQVQVGNKIALPHAPIIAAAVRVRVGVEKGAEPREAGCETASGGVRNRKRPPATAVAGRFSPQTLQKPICAHPYPLSTYLIPTPGFTALRMCTPGWRATLSDEDAGVGRRSASGRG